ncbi:MAG: outer membrane beta-barrel protein [Bacteroidales bacterium]|nr:outer membrane beta-barrel protein [Bacteroidales bacterium]
MTVDRSKIDEIFREKLKAYEVPPPYKVWEDIVVQEAERRKVRKRSMYLKIAASLLLLVVAGTLFLTPSDGLLNRSEQSRPPFEKQTFSNFVEEPPSRARQADVIEGEPKPSKSAESGLIAGRTGQSSDEDFPSAEKSDAAASLSGEPERTKDLLVEMNPLISGISSDNTVDEGLIVSGIYNIPTGNNPLISPENVSVASDVPKTTHFSLKATIAPVMSYRRLQNDASRLAYNTSESELFSYTGGLNFGYALSNRLSVHSGFYYSQIGQTVNEIRLGSDDFAQYGEEIFVRLNNSLGEVEVEPAKLLSAKPSESIENIVKGNRLLKFSYKLDASVVQRFEYVKIPLMVEYTMIDKNIDVSLVGGINSNFLVNQGVYLKNQTGNTRLIGNTTNIRQFNYSGAVGVGLEYNFTQQINMYLQPHMDYFLNSINYSETKTYPYSFAVHTGLSITF